MHFWYLNWIFLGTSNRLPHEKFPILNLHNPDETKLYWSQIGHQTVNSSQDRTFWWVQAAIYLLQKNHKAPHRPSLKRIQQHDEYQLPPSWMHNRISIPKIETILETTMKENLSFHHQWETCEIHFLNKTDIFSVWKDEVFIQTKEIKISCSFNWSLKVTLYPYAMASIGQNNFIIRVNTMHGMNQSVNKIVGLRWKFQFRKRANVVVHLDDLQTVNFNISFRESSEC